MLTKKEETKIIALLKKGNTQSFSILYEEYIEKIYKFIFYKTLNKETAEDLTSDTFHSALEKINQFNPNKGNLSMWIYTIARNNIRDHFRNYKENFSIESAWDLQDESSIEEDKNTKLTFETLQPHLEKLDYEKREILILRIWQDLTFKEIAQITGKSESSLKMSLKRTIENLKSQMPLSAFILLLLY